MPYTRTWNDATPAGTRAANQIDSAIQEFKVDVHERMDSLVVDWTDDPVVLKDENRGTVAEKYLIIGPHGFHTTDDEDDNNWRDNHFEPEVGKTARTDFVVPLGVTILAFSMVVDRQAAGTVTGRFYRQEFSTGTQTLLETLTTAVSGVQLVTSAAPLAEVTSNDRFYVAVITSSNPVSGPEIYGIRIKYSVPDSRNTI
jgi:hypothetical protein